MSSRNSFRRFRSCNLVPDLSAALFNPQHGPLIHERLDRGREHGVAKAPLVLGLDRRLGLVAPVFVADALDHTEDVPSLDPGVVQRGFLIDLFASLVGFDLTKLGDCYTSTQRRPEKLC